MINLRGLLFLVGLVLVGFGVFAQAPTSSDSTKALKSSSKVLVVPFEDRMFFTDIMRELSQGSGMPPQEVVNSLRMGIIKSIGVKLSDADSSTFLHPDSLDRAALESIYEQLAYQFTPVRISPKNLEKEPTGIQEGQVRTVHDTTTRYMAASLKDTAILGRLRSDLGVQKFIFLNQMEVKMDLSDPDMLAFDPHYIVAVHYSILDAKGTSLASGLVSRKFSKGDHNISLMMFATFPDIAKTIVTSEKKSILAKPKSSKKP